MWTVGWAAIAWASNTITYTPEPDRVLAPDFAIVSGTAVGDFDADGFDDLVYAAGDGVALYRGGAGGLSDSPAMEWSVTGATLHAADVSGDGVDDLVIGAPDASNYGGELRVYFGDPGSGLGATPDHVSAGTLGANIGSALVPAGDLDGDGHDDLLAAEQDGFAWTWWRGAPTGLVRGLSKEAAWSTVLVAAGDVTGDGYGELAHASSVTGMVTVSLGSAAGPGANVWIERPSVRSMVMADVTGDGIDDLLVYEDDAVPEPLLHVYTTDGVSLSTTPVQSTTVPGGAGGGLVRVDLDGVQYLVLGHGESGWISPALTLPPDAASWGGPWAVASSRAYDSAVYGSLQPLAGDLDGDGADDLVFSAAIGWNAGDVGGSSPLVHEEAIVAVWHAPLRGASDTGGTEDTGVPPQTAADSADTGAPADTGEPMDDGRGCGCGGGAPGSWTVLVLTLAPLLGRRRS